MVFIDLLKTLSAQDTVAHIGPSILYERFRYYRDAVSKVCIAEPDPVRFATLQKNIPATDRFCLIENAVMSEGRRAELRRYNFDALTTVCDTAALNSLFPGLRETNRIAVGALTVASFLEKLPQHHRGRDLLIIDSLGQEFDLLKEFDACGGLIRFSGVIMRLAIPSARETPSTPDQLDEWLNTRHFNRPIVLDGADPDLAVLYFQRNPLSEHLKQQQSIVESLRTETKKQKEIIEKATVTAEKADSDLRVALRLQTAAQDDLKDLQRQYAALYADKERQDKLLRQVTRKLAYASNHLHQLAAEAPEFAGLVETAPLDKDDDEAGAAEMRPDKADGAENKPEK